MVFLRAHIGSTHARSTGLCYCSVAEVVYALAMMFDMLMLTHTRCRCKWKLRMNIAAMMMKLHINDYENMIMAYAE